MRRRFQELLTEEMRKNENIYLLVGDVGYKIFDHLREDYPDRVINPGAAEQLMLGMAVGLAMEGKILSAIRSRPLFCIVLEFIRNFLHNERIPVKLVGSGRNDDYGPCGFSHYACEDMRVMDALPNIEVFRPDTKEEVDIEKFLYSNCPSYINLKR